MPSLHWIGKEKVVNHHHDVPFKVLNKQYTFNADDENHYNESKIIHGDNLEALKALLPEYEDKVKCIYIDPPYNTGNEGWVYNDSVNDPKIRKWLEKTLRAKDNDAIAGIGIDDLARHDKWLCMMYPRLKLLHKLLSSDGVIFISIDDNEQASLKLVCDEIFGIENFITQFIWEKKKKPAFLSNHLGSITEFVTCYAKNKYALSEFSTRTNKTTENKKYPINNAGNPLLPIKFKKESVKFSFEKATILPQDMSEGNIKTKLKTALVVDNYTNTEDFILEGEWRYSQNTIDRIIENKEIIHISKIPFRPNHIKLGGESKKIHNYLSYKTYNINTNEDASAELALIFGTKVFNFSKPSNLIEFLVEISTDSNSIILDSFAGSGTTAHAVLNLNTEDGGNRKFILIEMEEYAESITAERVKRVINGYAKKTGTGGSFSYYSLGEPLFTGENNEYLNEAVGIDKIRNYVWYSETRSQPLSNLNTDHPFLGKHQETAYYLFYDAKEFTSLDYQSLETINIQADQYIIYADNCLLSKDFLLHHHIIFKKIPRDISRF